MEAPAPSPDTFRTFGVPGSGPDVLAVGAFLKNAVCVLRGGQAWLSVALGDLDSPEACRAFERTVGDVLHAAGATPVVIVHDLHPNFHSTRYAQTLAAERRIPALAAQHHHAHAAAVAAEQGLDGAFLALTLDGFGLGRDGGAWGGELLVVEGAGFARLGHLAPLAQPGGDVAARQPWRMAASVLHRQGRGAEIASRFADQPHAERLALMLDRGLNCPPTSSAGRLFDAACGLVGLHPVASHEGQAPMALERLATAPCAVGNGFTLDAETGVLDFLPLLAHLDRLSPPEAANRFHGTLALGLAEWAAWAREKTGLARVALSGGCFLNRVLTRELEKALLARGLTPLPHRVVSPGDAGLSLGQAWIGRKSLL